jgi:hypothetical protein
MGICILTSILEIFDFNIEFHSKWMGVTKYVMCYFLNKSKFFLIKLEF